MGIGQVWLLQLPAYILPMLCAQKCVVANIFSLVEYEHICLLSVWRVFVGFRLSFFLVTGVTEYEKIVLPMMKSQEHPSVVLSGKSLFPDCCVRLYRCDFSFFFMAI